MLTFTNEDEEEEENLEGVDYETFKKIYYVFFFLLLRFSFNHFILFRHVNLSKLNKEKFYSKMH